MAFKSSTADNWQDQPNYCEVWSENATVLGSMRPITEALGVMLRACRFGSTGMEGQIGTLFTDIRKPITVFFLGDHDPSGHDIERDTALPDSERCRYHPLASMYGNACPLGPDLVNTSASQRR